MRAFAKGLRIALLIAVVPLCQAQSEPPVPRPSKSVQQPQAETQQRQKAAAEDKRGTAQAPMIIEIPPAEDAKVATERERKAEEEKASNERLIARATVALAVITLGLATFTWKLWSTTGDLVKSAEINAERQLRAYIFVEVLLEDRIAPTPSGNVPWRIKVRVTNHGTTPAVLTKIRAYAPIVEPTPNELLASVIANERMPDGKAIGPNFTEDILVDCRVSNEQWPDIEGDGKRVYCVGRIEYRDVLGKDRETGFCWHLTIHGSVQRFTISPRTPLNYYT